jgi:hypothetical protein
LTKAKKEQGWRDLGGSGAGLRQSLAAKTDYVLEVKVSGQRVTLRVNGALILERLLSQALQGSPIGLYGFAKGNVHFKDFTVSPRKPRAFVVMQFSTPYNELYSEVIKPVCASEGIEAIRVDESFSNGLIISEINQMIDQSSIVIAEITPANPNVYYEVGYAHALRKPTILVAERGCKLPFDLSPFRVLMYENSIDGKNRIEKGLRSHLRAIFKGGLD